MICLKNNNKNKQGFNIVEIVVVVAISAALLGSLGISAYYFQRNSLNIEQIGQELASEIRVLQSKILAVQDVNGSIPKAIVIELKSGQDVVTHYIRYSGGTCNYYHSQNMDILNKLENIIISPAASVYISYISPSADFVATSSTLKPSFIYRASDRSCNPTGSVIPSGLITINLNNGSQDYYVKIDAKNGSVTPTPNL